MKKQAKKEGDTEAIKQLNQLFGEEKALQNRMKTLKTKDEVEGLAKVKQENKERAHKGLEPIFKKKRELKEMGLETKFNKLQKSGKLEKFMHSKAEYNDGKR